MKRFVFASLCLLACTKSSGTVSQVSPNASTPVPSAVQIGPPANSSAVVDPQTLAWFQGGGQARTAPVEATDPGAEFSENHVSRVTNPLPSIQLGKPTITPGLPIEVVQRIVRQNFGRFRLCYEIDLRTNPGVRGKLEILFRIGKDGSVAPGVKGKMTEGTLTTTIDCAARAIASLAFPQPEKGPVDGTYPMTFNPPSP